MIREEKRSRVKWLKGTGSLRSKYCCRNQSNFWQRNVDLFSWFWFPSKLILLLYYIRCFFILFIFLQICLLRFVWLNVLLLSCYRQVYVYQKMLKQRVIFWALSSLNNVWSVTRNNRMLHKRWIFNLVAENFITLTCMLLFQNNLTSMLQRVRIVVRFNSGYRYTF